MLGATDFSTVEVWTLRGLVRYHVLFVIRLSTRRVEIAGIVPEPDGEWMSQIARNLTSEADGFLRRCGYLIHDRSTLFTREFHWILRNHLLCRWSCLVGFASKGGGVEWRMAKWKKQSHCVYQCKYHIVWCPKYRYRVLSGDVGEFVDEALRGLCERKRIEVLELNVQSDHVHAVLQIPPKWSVSEVLGFLKGKSAIKLFKSFPGLKKKPYWGNHFWARGYCVTTVGMDEEKIRRYVRYQEENEKREEGDEREFGLF